MMVRTVVNLDGFFWLSGEIWNDATFACDHDKHGWQRCPVAQERQLSRLLGDMVPAFDGENTELDIPVELIF
jgi:hypothetical protein